MIAGIELMECIRKGQFDWDVWVSKVDRGPVWECRAPSLKSRQHNTGRFPAPAICTRAIRSRKRRANGIMSAAALKSSGRPA